MYTIDQVPDPAPIVTNNVIKETIDCRRFRFLDGNGNLLHGVLVLSRGKTFQVILNTLFIIEKSRVPRNADECARIKAIKAQHRGTRILVRRIGRIGRAHKIIRRRVIRVVVCVASA